MTNLKTLTEIRKIDFLIIANLALIILALCLFNYTDIDVKIQNHLFDFAHKTWLIDKDEPVKKFIFYKFPKILFGVAIVFCLIATVLGFKKNSPNRHKFFLIILGLSLIPLIAGNIKKFTNVYCPTQLEIYGEKYPYVKIFDSYPKDFQQIKKAQCFPAGHPVTGFALFILFFAFEKKAWRIFGFIGALTLGSIMGFYQMAKGAHFFGDTVVAMLVCFLIAAIIARIHKDHLAKRSL